jgi:hypothetical protein
MVKPEGSFMANVRSLESDLAYVKALLGAGAVGIASARRELAGRVFAPPLHPAAWTPAAVGATVGLTTGLIRKRKSRSSVAIGGLVGSVLGFSAALAWTSRHFTAVVCRRAVRHVNATRDAHWLEANPIDYA